ncbi:hypothetical protein Pmani_007799 [Petrolisthes manimaculis]|uniref:Uncharacterized protein n=1 Tax=Petrolisthes manimaculis TaxID=1843537 RepID=A0AAE1Q6W9_9EUCA|nr:hypothetical protein Pmani_007799 [Petrolisthes manimaculis]
MVIVELEAVVLMTEPVNSIHPASQPFPTISSATPQPFCQPSSFIFTSRSTPHHFSPIYLFILSSPPPYSNTTSVSPLPGLSPPLHQTSLTLSLGDPTRCVVSTRNTLDWDRPIKTATEPRADRSLSINPAGNGIRGYTGSGAEQHQGIPRGGTGERPPGYSNTRSLLLW